MYMYIYIYICIYIYVYMYICIYIYMCVCVSGLPQDGIVLVFTEPPLLKSPHVTHCLGMR